MTEAPLSQQAAAVEAALRIIVGAVKNPRPSERKFLTGQLEDAARTLRELSEKRQ